MIPENFQLLYSSEHIAAAVRRVAEDVTRWASAAGSEGKDIIAVPILRGGIYFFADLTRQVRCSLELAPVRVRAYVHGQNFVQRDEMEIVLDGLDVRGRSLLLVDDICDTGRTLKALTTNLLALGASEVRTAVLVQRTLETAVFAPDWSGFQFGGSEWFVGYGMEDKNRFSNLPSIYIVR
jgi:hypoxanthine phosphoribosyltransferase